MTDEKKLRNQGADEIEPEVEGHAFKMRATDQPQPGDETDAEGHVLRKGAKDDEPEVEGQSRSTTPRMYAEDSAEAQEDEVEGHMNPLMAGDVARARQQDFLSEAERNRIAQAAKGPKDRDGGIIDKIKRFTDR